MQSMAALERYYRDDVVWYDEHHVMHRGWWSGPNLFVCIGSPNPEWDGIFQGTPVMHAGTHAGACNDNGPGIEIVGNFDLAPWGAELYAFILDLAVTICRKGNLTASAIIGHRDCGSPKTCPGSKVDLEAFRGQVAGALSTNGAWEKWGDEYPLPVSQRGYGIPQAWLANMRSTQPGVVHLGAAKSFPVYDNTQGDYVVQLFEHGLVEYSQGKATVINYKRRTT